MPQKKNAKVKKGGKSKQRKVTLSVPALLGIGCIPVLIVVAVVIGMYLGRQGKTEDIGALVSERQSMFATARNEIAKVLSTHAGSSTVYDVKGNVLFTLSSSTDVVGVEMDDVPQSLQRDLQALLYDGQPKKINLSELSGELTVGVSQSEKFENAITNSLGWVSMHWLLDYMPTLAETYTDLDMLVVASELDKQVSANDLLRFCWSAGRFGNIRGVTNVSSLWFGKPLDELTAEQLQYLVYAYGNSAASWDDYAELYPESVVDVKSGADFGLKTEGDPYWLLRYLVQRELRDIPGLTLDTANYNIRLRVDPRIQASMQSALDNSMASAIGVGSDGQTVLDGTAMAIDTATGFVVAAIGSRSPNSISTPMVLRTANALGNYAAAKNVLNTQNELAPNSLMSYQNASGTTESGAFMTLTANGQLGYFGATPSYEPTIALDDVANFFVGLYRDGQYRLIEQVIQTSGFADDPMPLTDENGEVIDDGIEYEPHEPEKVYTAKALKDVSNDDFNPDIRCLIMGSTDAKGVDYSQYTDVGIATASANTEVIVCGLYGATAVGYTLSESDYSLCAQSALSVVNSVLHYYPGNAKTIDPKGVVQAKVEKAYEENKEYITAVFDGWVDGLKAMSITSTDEREDFEEVYQYYTDTGTGYRGLVTEEVLSAQLKRLADIRAERADELLQYTS